MSIKDMSFKLNFFIFISSDVNVSVVTFVQSLFILRVSMFVWINFHEIFIGDNEQKNGSTFIRFNKIAKKKENKIERERTVDVKPI